MNVLRAGGCGLVNDGPLTARNWLLPQAQQPGDFLGRRPHQKIVGHWKSLARNRSAHGSSALRPSTSRPDPRRRAELRRYELSILASCAPGGDHQVRRPGCWTGSRMLAMVYGALPLVSVGERFSSMPARTARRTAEPSKRQSQPRPTATDSMTGAVCGPRNRTIHQTEHDSKIGLAYET